MDGTTAGDPTFRVSMLLDNHFGPDPRVNLECQALSRAGAQVRVIAWDRRSPSQRRESEPAVMPPGVEIVRVPMQAPAGGGRSTFVAMLRFARAVWRRRAELTAGSDLLVAHDIYLLPLGRALALRMRLPFVYDAHEEYAAMEARRYPAWWLRCASAAETLLARRAAAVIVPGESRIPRWRDARSDRPILLRNLGLDECDVPQGEDELRWDIAYCGTLAEVRRLDLLLEVARRRPDARIVIAGRGRGEAEVERAAGELDNVEYRGWATDADAIVRASRAIYYGLDPAHPYAEKACPNTLYDAVRLSRPLLYFCGGDVAEIAARYRIGVRCEPTAESLIAGLEAVREPDARWDFGPARAHLWTGDATEAYVSAILRAARTPGTRRPVLHG